MTCGTKIRNSQKGIVFNTSVVDRCVALQTTCLVFEFFAIPLCFSVKQQVNQIQALNYSAKRALNEAYDSLGSLYQLPLAQLPKVLLLSGNIKKQCTRLSSLEIDSDSQLVAIKQALVDLEERRDLKIQDTFWDFIKRPNRNNEYSKTQCFREYQIINIAWGYLLDYPTGESLTKGTTPPYLFATYSQYHRHIFLIGNPLKEMDQ